MKMAILAGSTLNVRNISKLNLALDFLMLLIAIVHIAIILGHKMNFGLNSKLSMHNLWH